MPILHKSKVILDVQQQLSAVKIKADGQVIFKDGSSALLLECGALNLALMGRQQQQAILTIYKELLDALNVKCQILVCIRPQSATSGDFKEVAALTQTPIVNRYFYFIIRQLAGSGDQQSTSWQLSLQAQLVLDYLQRLGLKAKVLECPAVAELYFQAFNPLADQPRRQAWLTTKARWSARSGALNQLAYRTLVERRDYLRINQTYVQTLVIRDYPAQIDSQSLSDLLNSSDYLDISYQLEPVDKVLALEKLNRRLAELESHRRSQLKRGQLLSPQVTDPLESALTLRAKLLRGQETLYRLAIYVTLSAASLVELRRRSLALQTLVAGKLFNLRPATYSQIPAFMATLPQAEPALPAYQRNFDSSTLALTFPFSSLELIDQQGFFYGLNKANQSPVILNRFALGNANAVICAQSGAGKSYLAKLEILRAQAAGLRIIVLDPEGEYQALCQHLKGTSIVIKATGEQALNPLYFNQRLQTLPEKLSALIPIFNVMLEGLSQTDQAILDKLLLRLYKRQQQPQLADLYKLLKQQQQTALCLKLERYVTGSLKGLFNQPTSFNLEAQLTVFNLQHLSVALRPLVMMIISDCVYEQVLKKPEQRLLVIDEAWLLLQDRSAREFLNALVRRARKYYLGVTLISQQLADFNTAEARSALLAQASLKILLRQDDSQLSTVADQLVLSRAERRFLLTAATGEALLLAGNRHVLLRVLALPGEHPLITTNPAEIYKGE